jgi:hypothetical protein
MKNSTIGENFLTARKSFIKKGLWTNLGKNMRGKSGYPQPKKCP